MGRQEVVVEGLVHAWACESQLAPSQSYTTNDITGEPREPALAQPPAKQNPARVGAAESRSRRDSAALSGRTRGSGGSWPLGHVELETVPVGEDSFPRSVIAKLERRNLDLVGQLVGHHAVNRERH